MSELKPFTNPAAMLCCLKLELTDPAQIALIDRVILSLPPPHTPNADHSQVAALGEHMNKDLIERLLEISVWLSPNENANDEIIGAINEAATAPCCPRVKPSDGGSAG